MKSKSDSFLTYYFLFRQGLIQGDIEIIYPILMWLLTHIDMVQKRAYLSQFLVKVRYLGDKYYMRLYIKLRNLS